MKRTNERTNERARAVPASPIAAALAQLQLERDNLASRLEKVDALIVSMRDVFHLPRSNGNGHAPPRPRKAAATKARDAGNGDISADAIRAALRRGPMAPGELAEALSVDRARLRACISELEEQGVVTTSGTTASRRIALADGSAKEAP